MRILGEVVFRGRVRRPVYRGLERRSVEYLQCNYDQPIFLLHCASFPLTIRMWVPPIFGLVCERPLFEVHGSRGLMSYIYFRQ